MRIDYRESGKQILDGKIEATNVVLDRGVIGEGQNLALDTGIEIIDSFDPIGDGSAMWLCVVKKAGNIREQTVNAVWDDSLGQALYRGSATNEFGDTSDVTFSVDMSGAYGSVQLKAQAISDSWQVSATRLTTAVI